MSIVQRLRPAAFQVLAATVRSRNTLPVRAISNTPKSNDTAATHGHDSHDSHGSHGHGHGHGHHDEPVVKNWRHPSTELPKDYKEWAPFLLPFDKEKDDFVRRGIMFSVIVVMFCWVPFLWAYGPDHSLQNWSYREAFLEIERRRRAGLPLISPDLVEPEKVAAHLPSDEELGEFEIVI